MPVETAFTGLHIRGRTYCPGGIIALITEECRIKNGPGAEPGESFREEAYVEETHPRARRLRAAATAG
jgi:hypothetical protein